MGLELAWGRLRRAYLRRFRPAYVRALKAYLQELQAGCEASRCDYVLVDTSRPVAETLTEYLARRLRVA